MNYVTTRGNSTDHFSLLNAEFILNEDMSGKIHFFAECLIDFRVFFEQQILDLETCARKKNTRSRY